MSVKICGYCKERVNGNSATRVDFTVGGRHKVLIWFCSPHCCFWGGVLHARTGSASTVTALRERFGAGLELVKPVKA